MAKKRKSKKENIFVRFWNGELSLPASYWGIGLLGGLLYGGAIGIFTMMLGMSEDAMWGFIIPFQIYTVVGIWRSSDKYKGPKFWAVLAKIGVVLGIISNLGSLVSGA